MVCNFRKIFDLQPCPSVPQPPELVNQGSDCPRRSPFGSSRISPPVGNVQSQRELLRSRQVTLGKLCLLAVGLVSSGSSNPTTSATPSLPQPQPSAADAARQREAAADPALPPPPVLPSPSVDWVEFSSDPGTPFPSAALASFQAESQEEGGNPGSGRSPQSQALSTIRPKSGAQLYHQRQAALQAGSTYTRLPADSFSEVWLNATDAPNLQDWHTLLEQEAKAMAAGQGDNQLTVMLGDSISLWYPRDYLPQQRFWLNQAISGDTAKGMLKRLDLFDQARPNQIHVMAGINDLRQGATDQEVVATLAEIIHQLQQRHPDAQVIVHAILPTRLPSLPTWRIQGINRQVAAIAKERQATYVDLHSLFLDQQRYLRRELTTDGLHLSPQGYAVWYAALQFWGLT